MRPVTLAAFEHEGPARRLKERLDAAGFPADVLDERVVQRFWFLNKPHAGVRLRVGYPQMTRFFLLPTIICYGLMLMGMMKRRFYCRQCHHTWEYFPTSAQPDPAI